MCAAEMLVEVSPEHAGFDVSRLQRADELLERAVADGVCPGAVALVARRGQVIFWRAVGHRMVEPELRPMQRDTIFDCASVTKAVATATALMMLVECGEVALSDLVERYLPQYRGGARSTTTLLDLLTHTSGLPLLPELHHDYDTPDALWQQIYTVPLVSPPRTSYTYTCLGYHLLGAVIELVVGDSLDTFLRRQVFEPLRMLDTGYCPGLEHQKRCAATERCRWRGRVICGEVHDENCSVLGGISGNAGLFSTAWDVATFATMMINGGSLASTRILSPLTVQAMFRNHTAFTNTAWGLGWGINLPQFGDTLYSLNVGHTGWTGTSICLCPTLELAIVLLTNRVHPIRENDRIDSLRIRFHNVVASALVDP